MATDWLVWFTDKTLISTLGQKDIPSPVTVELGRRKPGDVKAIFDFIWEKRSKINK